ncbi:hypothetical protein DV738_g475, partial [Chaetothyriales sp. CBS 135597]
MGISGLLPLLKSIQKPCSLKNFKGQTIGVDAYGWLHRGTVACAIELALDKPTLKYAEFAINRVKMLQAFGVTPYLVFDGDALPSKAGTNAERRKRRVESKRLGLELYRAGKVSQAHQELQKAAEVTYHMARQLIEDLKKLNIQYIVAPYEADAQLVYLEQKGIIDGILSEDSDMLVYGAKRLITKLDQYGNCIMIDRADFALCKDISLAGWTDDMFRRMAILSGCDYLPNINKIGLKTAYRFVRKHKETQKIIRMIALEGKLAVPADYLERFLHAELTFLHHRVFCPLRQEMVHMRELPRALNAEDMPYLGPYVEPDTIIGVACGDLNPRTKEALFPRSVSTSLALAENKRQATSAVKCLKSSKSIESFFGPKRQPLAELDPNSLTPSPSQQRVLERNRNASWIAREVSSAPQLRRAVSDIPPWSASGTDRGSFLARAAKASEYQPPKRQRLCSDTPSGRDFLSDDAGKSPFFASPTPQQLSPLVEKKMRNSKKARTTRFDIFSDDSVDDVLLGLSADLHTEAPSPVLGSVGQDQDLATDGSEEVVKTACPNIDSIPQSSPPPVKRSEDDDDGKDLDTQDGTQVEVEPFEDLLESHIRMQKTLHLTSFVYQSPPPSGRSMDLLQRQQQKRSRTERRDYPSTTFIAQSPSRQQAALKSLPSRVDNVCEKAISESKSSPPTAAADDLDEPPVFPARENMVGSEDALVPASDSDDDDEVSDVDSPRPGWQRALNLARFAYVGRGVPVLQIVDVDDTVASILRYRSIGPEIPCLDPRSAHPYESCDSAAERSTGLDRSLDSANIIGYHHVLMIFIAAAIILLSLLLAGCSSTSPLIPDIYLISLYYQKYAPVFSPTQVDPGVTTAIANVVGNADLTVRVGYFGICIRSEGSGWMCNTNSTALADLVSVDQDPLNLIWVASTFKNAIVFPYLLIIAIVLAFLTFLLLATFPGWHTATGSDGSEHEVKPFPSRPVSQVALATIFISSVFVLVSVMWQHTAAVAASTVAQDLGNGSVKSGVGTSAMVLGWFGFGLLVVVTLGLLVMILSIQLLDRLADEE